MEKVEGIDLSQLVVSVEDEFLLEKRKKICASVSGMISDLVKWKEEKNKLNKQITELESNITKVTEKLTKVKNGDWSVLNVKFTE